MSKRRRRRRKFGRHAGRSPDRRAPQPSSIAVASGTSAYLAWSRSPWASLLLLLPLLVFHELSLLVGSGVATGETVAAYRMIERAVSAFGVVGAALPAVMTVGLLVGLHLMRRDPWVLRPGMLGLMLIEALVWALPLYVVQSVLGGALLARADGDLGGLLARINLAVGAGLYEELIFRLLLVGGLRWTLVELLAVRGPAASIASVGISALLFSLYHDPWAAGAGEGLGLFVVYAVGGVFFGVLYLMRGFGLTAGSHAAYDIWVITSSG